MYHPGNPWGASLSLHLDCDNGNLPDIDCNARVQGEADRGCALRDGICGLRSLRDVEVGTQEGLRHCNRVVDHSPGVDNACGKNLVYSGHRPAICAEADNSLRTQAEAAHIPN